MHLGVGFYGGDAADGGSRNAHLSGLADEGDVRKRIDADRVNAVGGAGMTPPSTVSTCTTPRWASGLTA